MGTRVKVKRIRRGNKLTPVHFSEGDTYRRVVNYLQVHHTFNRIQIAIATGVKFGTVSRILAEMANEGYLEHTGWGIKYGRQTRLSSRDLWDKDINYGTGPNPLAAIYRWKPEQLASFFHRYAVYRDTGQDPEFNQRLPPRRRPSYTPVQLPFIFVPHRTPQ
jgi:hypothetical protein